MKKILSIALVALLVASTAFAGFSGKAKLSLGYDTESESYGFSNGQEFSVDLDVASETAEAKGEGEVFAGVKATLSLKAVDKIGENPEFFVKGEADVGFGLFLSLKEAYVAGQDWKVSITGTQNGPDFAKSAIDVVEDYGKDAFGNQPKEWWNKTYKAKSYAVSVNKAPGVTATYKDWSVAAGFNGGKASAKTLAPDFFNYHVSAISPEVAVAEGISVKVGAVASGIKNATEKTEIREDVFADLYKESKNFDAFGASAQVAYAAEAFSAKVAGDFGMKKTVGTDDFKPGFDIAANVAYAPVAVDVYFSRVKEVNYLSAQVSGAYEGISGDIYAKNILAEDKDIKIGADAEYTVDAVTVGAGFEMTTDSKKMKVSGNVEYAAEKFTAKAGAVYGTQIDVKDSSYLRLNASVESSAIIPGATISLGYGPNKLMDGTVTTNLLKEKYGAVTAQCVIAF